MTLEFSPQWDGRDKRVAYMETFGRLVVGLSSWLNLPDDTPEGRKRAQIRQWALKSYTNGVNPESFLRSPGTWQSLDLTTCQHYV